MKTENAFNEKSRLVKFTVLGIILPTFFFVIVGCNKTSNPAFLNKAPEPRFHTIQAKAYDAAGNVGESSAVTVKVQQQ